jgi:hypothetical protein
MRFRGLLVAVVVLAALGGAVYWSNKVKKAQEGKPAADAPPQILTIPEAQFQRLELRKAGSEPVVLQKNASGRWEMLSPPNWAVDQDAVGGIVNTLASLASSRLVEEKTTDLSPFGLAAPLLNVTIGRRDGKTQRLLLGDDSPAGGGTFAKLDGDPRVFTIASYSKSGLEKTARDLRDKRLLTFDPEKLTRVELVAKGQTTEFGRNSQNEWQIIRPRPLRADGGQVEELVRRLTEARMDATVTDEDEKKAASSFSGAAPAGVARTTDASGTQQIEIRKDKEGSYYARSSAIEGVHRVASDVGVGLEKSLDDFRNKKVFDFGFSDPVKVEIRDGARQAAYQKLPDKWMSGSTQMDAATVNAVVDRLRNLTAAKFVDRGLTAPIFEAAVTSNGGKRVEKVFISKEGADFFARREGEPSVYQLDAQAVADLQKVASAVKAYQPPKPDTKKK